MQISSLKICSLFFKLTLFWLIIDCINGFCISNGINLPISLLYKFIIAILLIFGLIKIKDGIKLVSFIIIYTIFLILHLSINVLSPQIGTTINHLFRFIISVLIYFFTIKYIKLFPLWSYNSIRKTFNIGTIIVVINILAGLLGFGYSAYYKGETGFRGYFNAGNELSGVVMILFPFVLYELGLKYGLKSKQYISTLLILLTTVALMGTKTALLVMLLTIPIIPLLYKKHINIVKLAIIFSLSILILGIILYHVLDSFGLLNRWLWFYDKGGLERLIFSGRDGFWEKEKVEFYNANLFIQLFGLGESRTVEMDPFDALLNYGYVGFFLCYTFYFYLLIKSWRYRKKNMIAKLIFYINILILGASSFAGHIIFSGMASWLIALINTLIYIPDHILLKRKNEKQYISHI